MVLARDMRFQAAALLLSLGLLGGCDSRSLDPRGAGLVVDPPDAGQQPLPPPIVSEADAQNAPEASVANSCTDLLNDSPLAPVQFHAGERPSDALGAGGAIADGVYDLVSSDIYRSTDDSTPLTTRITIRLSGAGTTLEWVTDGVGLVRTLSATSTQLAETETCRSWGPDSLQPPTVEDYTATDTTFMLSNPTWVGRFARRAP